MCEQKILAANDHGYIGRCPNCKRYQVAFGSALFAFTRFQMKTFRDNANAERVLNADVEHPEKKQIYLHTFCENGAFVLNRKELDSLIDLLAEASHAEKLRAIYELNNIQTN